MAVWLPGAPCNAPRHPVKHSLMRLFPLYHIYIMYKKRASVSQKSLLGGKDLKALRVLVRQSLPAISDEQLTELLPNKCKLTISKMSNRSIVYGLDGGDPLFFDTNGHGDRVFPTIYTLARLPDLVETCVTYSEVSGKVLGGADLFLQGFIIPRDGPVPSFLANSPRALVVPGNPIPFAIGTMASSSQEAEASGWKGRGLTVLHTFGDLLWQMGTGTAPNPGFTPSRIFPLERPAGGCVTEPSTESSAKEECESISGSDDWTLTDVGELEHSNERDEQPSIDQEIDIEALALVDTDQRRAGPEDGAGAEGLDAALERAVILGLLELKNSELPIQFSDFFDKHMMHHRPSGLTFDMKKSKYKKLSKLLDGFVKQRVITQKVVRKHDTISGVYRDHPVFKTATDVSQGPGHAAAASGKGGASPRATSGSAAGSKPAAPPVETVALYRVPTSLRPVFEGAFPVAEKDRLFTEEEVTQALVVYGAAQGLYNGSDGLMKLDSTLVSALFGKKPEFAVGSAIPSRVLHTKLKDKLSLFTQFTRQTPEGPCVIVRKGPIVPVEITASKKRGHPVTVVTHLESFGIAAEAAVKDLQKLFSSACSMAPLPGKHEQDMEITMQGDLGSKVADYLMSKVGIPAQYITVKGAKKK